MSFIHSVALKVQTGSHLYGLSTPKSDLDYRGCFVPTDLSYLFNFKQKENIETKEPDMTLFDLRKFVSLALKGNTVALECLFASQEFVVDETIIGELLREMRKDFLSKRIYRVLKGYAQAEYRKTLGETTGDLGARRKEEVASLGYSPKNASHCLRLLFTGFKLFQTGEYLTTFDPQDRALLMKFKLGELDREEFKSCYEVFEHCLDKEFKENFYEIPDEPKEEEIYKALTDALKLYFCG